MAVKYPDVRSWEGLDVDYFHFETDYEKKRKGYPQDLVEMIIESFDKEGKKTSEDHITTFFPRIYDIKAEGLVCLVCMEFFSKDKGMYNQNILFQKVKNGRGVIVCEVVKKVKLCLITHRTARLSLLLIKL